MSTLPNTTTLPSGCGVCNKQENLLRCSSCKVIFYCGRDHQYEDRDEHKHWCKGVKAIRDAAEWEKEHLRNFRGGPMMSGDIFTTHIGRFWDLPPLQSWMRGEMGLVRTLSAIWSVRRGAVGKGQGNAALVSE